MCLSALAKAKQSAVKDTFCQAVPKCGNLGNTPERPSQTNKYTRAASYQWVLWIPILAPHREGSNVFGCLERIARDVNYTLKLWKTRWWQSCARHPWQKNWDYQRSCAMDVEGKVYMKHLKNRIAEIGIIYFATCVEVVQQNLINDVSLRVVEFHIPLCMCQRSRIWWAIFTSYFSFQERPPQK